MVKKTILLLTILVAIISCSKEEEIHKLSGTFTLLEISNLNCDDSRNDASWDLEAEKCVVGNQDVECTGFEVTYTFKDDGSFMIESNGTGELFQESVIGNFSTTGDTISICDTDDDCINGTFEFKNGKLYIYSQDDPDENCDLQMVFRIP